MRIEIADVHPTWNDGDTLLPLDAADRPGMRSGLPATNETSEEDRAGAGFGQQEGAIYLDSERRRSRGCVKEQIILTLKHFHFVKSSRTRLSHPISRFEDNRQERVKNRVSLGT